MEILDRIPPELDFEGLLGRVRISPESADATAVRRLFDQVQPCIQPKAIYALCAIGAREEDTIEIGGVTFASRVLTVNLQHVHRAFPYICTCGAELDQVEASGDPLRDYWLDAIRLSALGSATSHLRQHLECRYAPGKLSSMAPGSLQDWPISQQASLFSLFGDVESKIGVRLTDSFLMRPLKSVSGIYFSDETEFHSCQLCPREGCPGRSAPYDPGLWEERYARQ